MLYEPERGRFSFMEVNTRLQVEHTVTEATTGVDLVKLQLELAAGATLPAARPERRGHAVEVRLNAEDPGAGFAPAAGRLLAFDVPSGPGIRVDSGLVAGDVIPSQFDSMIAKIIAWGRDRREALARLARALEGAVVVVDGGTTNRAFLLGLLRHPAVVAGRVDIGWLDRQVAAGEWSTGRHAPHALALAAVEAYDLEAAVDQRHVFSTAARGRPELRGSQQRVLTLSLAGTSYDLEVYRLGPATYRLRHGEVSVDLLVDRVSEYVRRIELAGERVTAVAVVDGPAHRIEIGAESHRVVRGGAGVVRSPSSGVVVSTHARVGATVAVGETLVVIEAMKMEMAVTAPFGGTVLEVLVEANHQVDAGAALVRLDVPLGTDAAVVAPAVDLAVLAGTPAADERSPVERAFAGLRNRLLGFDRDPHEDRSTLEVLQELHATTAADSPELFAAEEDIVELFTDVAAIGRRDGDRDGFLDGVEPSNEEHLFGFLRSMDRAEELLPRSFLDPLAALLARYGVTGFERSPELEEAVVRIARAQLDLDPDLDAIVAILDRWIRRRDLLTGLVDGRLVQALDRLVAVTEARFPWVADHARVTRYRYVDEPVLDELRERTWGRIGADLERLAAGTAGTERDAIVESVLTCPEDLRGLLLRWIRSDDRARSSVGLEALVRRLYRIRAVSRVRLLEGDVPVVEATYTLDGREVTVGAVAVPWVQLPSALARLGSWSRELPADREVVVDLVTWPDAVDPTAT
jgi:biotin carboxyl carrier protein